MVVGLTRTSPKHAAAMLGGMAISSRLPQLQPSPELGERTQQRVEEVSFLPISGEGGLVVVCGLRRYQEGDIYIPGRSS